MPVDDRSRLLKRAAREAESETSVWFGPGLPEQLESELARKAQEAGPVSLAFVEVQSVSGTGLAQAQSLPFAAARIIALGDCQPSELGGLIRNSTSGTMQIGRLICPFAVFDFTDEGPLLREIRHGLTAADLQAELDTTLWSGPDLCELS